MQSEIKDPVLYAKLLQRKYILTELVEEYGKNQELNDVLQDTLYQLNNIR